jgi:integrase
MRTKGEGTIQKLPNGSYKWKLRFGGSGKSKTVCRSAQNLKQLYQRRDQALAELKTLGHIDLDDTANIEQLVLRWINRRTISEATSRSYMTTLKHHIAPAIGSERVSTPSALLADKLIRYIKSHNGEGKARTMEIALTMLCSALGVDKRQIRSAMSESVPTPTRVRSRLLETNDDIQQFLSALHSDLGSEPRFRDRFAIEFLLWTGLRESEFVALRSEDYDADRETLHIHAQIDAKSGRRVEKTKTGLNRTIALHPRAIECIRQHNLLEVERSNVLFATSKGTPYNVRNLARTIETVCKIAGLERLSPHDLRRTFLTLFAESEANIKLVADYAGHRSSATTLKHYTHGRREQMRQAVMKLWTPTQ